MKLTGYGYGQRQQAVTFAAVKAKDDRVEYERQAPDGSSISEWYVNRVNGLEQGFTVPKAPVKRKSGERLNLWLELSGDLKARLAENGQAILLNRRAAGPGLRYDKLHAFDAKGRELEARMKLSGDQVRLEVVDESAIYPVTIDPTLAQEAKLTASDAAAGDLFGISVAIDGETAVVGARSDDTAAGTDAGSAPALALRTISGARPSSSRIAPNIRRASDHRRCATGTAPKLEHHAPPTEPTAWLEQPSNHAPTRPHRQLGRAHTTGER